jgi:hypothetical protein
MLPCATPLAEAELPGATSPNLIVPGCSFDQGNPSLLADLATGDKQTKVNAASDIDRANTKFITPP